jgi:ATP-binding cassette subfamily F protein uup
VDLAAHRGRAPVTIVSLIEGQLAFGLLPLLDRATLTLRDGERVGLIGRNGSGKSSLLQIIAGRLVLDEGELQRAQNLTIAMVEQEPELPPAATLRQSLILRGAFDKIDDERHRARLDARLNEFMQRFGVPADIEPMRASGGERKRAALALAFALEPGLLLLDEPTNHLDAESIAWLERYLEEYPSTVIAVTHDRYFLDNAAIEQVESAVLGLPGAAIVITHDRCFLDRVASRILELDRGVLRSYAGNFADYERQKAGQLATEAEANRRFDRFWAQEEAWIRKGIEARRTRNEGRVRRLESLRQLRAERRDRLGNVRFAIDAGERSGRLVAELENVDKSFATGQGARKIVERFSARIMRGDRIGLIGPNGCGKTTLIRLVLGQLEPDGGQVRRGSNVAAVYFDQLREQLDAQRTVADTISPGSDWIEINGARKHVVGYLADFLFPAQRAAAPVRMLSGGERNRLLLARLFARPANFLVLDEPTNDLDFESLELLEQVLQDYRGTLLIVSHDRSFLDNVVTQVWAAEGEGRWREYVGGYSDWLQQRAAPMRRAEADREPARAARRPTDPRRLSFKEQRELDALPGSLVALEREQRELHERMARDDAQQRAAARRHRRADRAAVRTLGGPGDAQAGQSCQRVKCAAMRTATLIVFGVVAAGAGAWLAWQRWQPPLLATTQATRGPAIDAVYATGTVEPSLEIRIAPRVAARIVELNADEGDVVRKGQLLARLEDADLRSSVAELESRLRYAEAQLKRANDLQRSQLVSQDTVERAATDFETAQASLRRAREQLAFMRIAAPTSGRIIRREGEIGEFIPVNQTIFYLAGPAPLRISADVDEEDQPRVVVGQRVLIRTDAFPTTVFEGRVTEITPRGDPVSRAYRVRIAIPEASPLQIGMTAETNIVIAERSQSLLVPTRAVRGNLVWVVEGNRARRRELEIGVRGPERIEVLAGLEPSDRIVEDPPAELEDGALIRPQAPAAAR